MGMRQRLAIAAALLGDPEVLILDEPANGLDPPGIRWMRELLRDQAGRGRAVLVSSHLLAEVAQSVDDVVVISHGELRGQRHRSSRCSAAAEGAVTRVRARDAERARRPRCATPARRSPVDESGRAARRAARRPRPSAGPRTSSGVALSSWSPCRARSRTSSSSSPGTKAMTHAAARRADQAAHHAHVRRAGRASRSALSLLITSWLPRSTSPPRTTCSPTSSPNDASSLFIMILAIVGDHGRVAPPDDHQLAAGRAGPPPLPGGQDARVRCRRAVALAGDLDRGLDRRFRDPRSPRPADASALGDADRSDRRATPGVAALSGRVRRGSRQPDPEPADAIVAILIADVRGRPGAR